MSRLDKGVRQWLRRSGLEAKIRGSQHRARGRRGGPRGCMGHLGGDREGGQMRTGEGGEANPVRMPEREQPGTEGEQGTCDQTSREEGSYAGGRVSRSASPTDGAWRSAPRSAFVDLPAAQVGASLGQDHVLFLLHLQR